ncbi:Eco57I restriction-modification methylase domain-containing protein [Haloferax sp. DFSO52]|uniref:Eco57I restriction-modification methylase domain-containing protein n=1 Tax=Haloferax sp. DFSO52 TaxID=3388505 RepID=UPI003A8BE4A0
MSQQTRRRDETTFIEPSGGILTEQLLHKLREEECSEAAVAPQTFALNGEEPSSTTELDDEIADVWEDLKERWDSISQDNTIYEMDTSEVRDRWLIPLLEHLDFEPAYQSKNLRVNGLEANLSHYGWAPEGQLGGEESLGLPPVTHLIQPDKDEPLDSGNHVGTRASGKSPHDELQRFLNAADQQWSLVADGLKLRLLRDYYHTYTRGYIEFDLENIFTNRNYEDFRALYRLCHASRFVVDDDTDEDDADAESPLESLYQVALATGVKIGEDLQSNVVEALETLGNGFLTPDIRSVLKEGGQDEADQYYQDLLRVVYRLLFLMFAEQRGMMADRGDLYTDEYSINTLRDRSERSKARDTETDLWEGLQVTFRLVGDGYEDDEKSVLSVPGYNGGLFDDSKLEYVTESTCPNHALLDAIHNLTHVEQEGYQQRISYADLGVDEIGAVYESLLEFMPKYADKAVELEDKKVSSGSFYLDDRGMDRKETGSYYTKPELVDELIDSALKPVVDNRVGDADTPEEKGEALLSIDVVDPACGSGAFLIAANNYLGKRLAEIRSGTEYPDEKVVREARRSVVQHCLYGVDLNPMAVELAKVSLWINSAVKDQPLSFLDHRIKQGNSLIGTTEELIQQGVPVDAYPTTGDCGYDTGNAIRKRIRNENKDVDDEAGLQAGLDWGYTASQEYLEVAEELEALDESAISDVERKAKLFEKLEAADGLLTQKLVHDVWTAAFYWPMDGSASEYPSPRTIERVRREAPHDLDDPQGEIDEMCARALDIAKRESFFHWELEFPLVFQKGGFDCVLGNPPWEQVELTEKEWFRGKHERIANSTSKSERRGLLNELESEDEQLYSAWTQAKSIAECTSKFIRESGRFRLSGVGEINTYPAFTELSTFDILSDYGKCGMIVKTGIATDYYTQDLFSELVEQRLLDSLYDFVNKRNLFPDVATRERFCLLTTTGCGYPSDSFSFSFFNWTLDDLHSPGSIYKMSKDELEMINPNTKNCPMFQTKEERDLAVTVYEGTPILIHEENETNTWDLNYIRIFDMANDSDLFADNTLEDLEANGYQRKDGNLYAGDGDEFLPLWEGKLFQQFDHRFATFEGIPKNKRFGRRAGTKKVGEDQKKNEDYEVIPRYWVNKNDFEDRKESLDWDQNWMFAFRETGGSASNSRTSIGTVLPMHPCSHKAPVLAFDVDEKAPHTVIFTTIFNSLIFDFSLQQSLGGASVSYYILKQLPMPTPQYLSNHQADVGGRKRNLADYLIDQGLKLLWTSHSLDGLGEEFPLHDGPFEWNSDQRREIRAELDAVIAKAYGLSKDEFEQLIDSFEILHKLEVNEHGYNKRKQMCLEHFDNVSLNIS